MSDFSSTPSESTVDRELTQLSDRSIAAGQHLARIREQHAQEVMQIRRNLENFRRAPATTPASSSSATVIPRPVGPGRAATTRGRSGLDLLKAFQSVGNRTGGG